MPHIQTGKLARSAVTDAKRFRVIEDLPDRRAGGPPASPVFAVSYWARTCADGGRRRHRRQTRRREAGIITGARTRAALAKQGAEGMSAARMNSRR